MENVRKITIRLNNGMEMFLAQDGPDGRITCGIQMDGETVGEAVKLDGEGEDALFQFCREEFFGEDDEPAAVTIEELEISRESYDKLEKILGMKAGRVCQEYGVLPSEEIVELYGRDEDYYTVSVEVKIPEDTEKTVVAYVTLYDEAEDIVDGDTCQSVDELKNCVLTDSFGDRYELRLTVK